MSAAHAAAAAVSRIDTSRAARSHHRPISPRQSPRAAAVAAAASAAAEEFATGQRRVELIVTDVDGTLLDPQQQLTPAVTAAINAAADAGVPLVIATGKAMGPWRDNVLPHIKSRLPQIYLQGLLINSYDKGVLYQRLLDEEVILEAIQQADELGLTLTAYTGDRVLCRETNEHTDRLLFYSEPTPEGIGRLEPYVGELPICKLLLMSSEERITEVRPAMEGQFAGRATLTTALPGMLEILPLGASKGAGVAWLLAKLGVDPSNVMALGDGENDVEMLELCGLGVAMGNAGAPARAVAKSVTASNAEDGVARAIERYVLQPRGLAVPEAAAAGSLGSPAVA